MKLSVAAAALAIAAGFPAAAGAEPGRISVGLAPGTPVEEAAAAVEEATGGEVIGDLGPLDALVVAVDDVDAALAAAGPLEGLEYAEPVAGMRRLAFTPNDPLFSKQWYLSTIRAFDHWAEQPPLAAVRVAVIDSGIDGRHPEFAGRIAAARSFVSTSATVDSFGHGTIVAGEIAAALGNATGIAGAGFPVELLVANVVGPRGYISLEAEARAIRWAADRGARVINLSLGGPRDPRHPERDTYSALEHSAVDYATKKGAVVVAAAGNCAFVCPEPYANYPAALPHVVGVSAILRNRATPGWSNRDRIHNDLAAPGAAIVSTFPRPLSDRGCSSYGYNACAHAEEYRNPRGTSFAAPLVSAAAALVLAERSFLGLPPIHASQVSAVLERSAADIGAAGRDSRSGNGLLDVQAALRAVAGSLPPRDRYEANDDAGNRAYPLWTRAVQLRATLDRYDDVADVYRVFLRRGQRGIFRLNGPARTNTNLFLWKPGTTRVTGRARGRAVSVAVSKRPGAGEWISYRARRRGWHFLEVHLVAGRGGQYRLSVAKSSVRSG
jgi:serine protease